jgi:hypothetical protein
VSELPAWAHVETEEEEATRLAAIFSRSDASTRIVALETVHAIKEELDDTPRWRLVRRWRLTRVAKTIVKEHELVA